MTNASRAQVDLDALARDLRQDGTRAPHNAGKADPLAELARIVGQDDPFRALLAARDEMRTEPNAQMQPGWNGRVEPSFTQEPPKATPADAFDQYLASVDQDTHQDTGPYAQGGLEPQDATDGAYEDGRALRRVNPRRRLISVGAGIAVVAVAVTGALTYKGMSNSGQGGVPVVQADTTPLKVAPKVADGVEIPDQNRQIYDPKGKKDGQIKIVNREEQPLDVGEAARAAQGPSLAGSAQGGTTPGNGPFEAFGEPRRVRTVAVKPEAPPAQPAREAAPADVGPAPIPTMVLPGDEPAPTKAKPVRQAAASLPPAIPAPVESAPAPVPVDTQTPKPVAVKPPPKAAQRVAAVAPAAPDTTASTSTSDDAAVSNGPVSGFSVQLGVRNSAADAKAAFRQMQAKYTQLAGKPELIRQAEVNGKTIYRVRVGPLDKAQAASLCTALQGQGGQCFVAKN
jgi:hypothetical protein